MTKAILEHTLGHIRYRDWWWEVFELPSGLLMQWRFWDDDGAEQLGRKWYVSLHATEEEVVQTALKAILTAQEHEIREQFTFKGKAIFGPHLSVEALGDIADRRVVRQ